MDLYWIMQHVFGRFMQGDSKLSNEFRREYYEEQRCSVPMCGRVLSRVFIV